ncbi:MAG: glycosyltransferase family 2 protein [Desulfatiglans sp.]|jgi:cellulose synthase (UDP-forming)|nr:glycosyltransferase family 2 protein [Thermodesulfobacteriota bacterium]MEE4354612.1 glycosyltransferase family 2 protein [Desulfatiglans sp.]
MKNETLYKAGRSILLLLPILCIVLAVLYLLVRTFLFLILDYHWYEKIVALFLLFAETFIIIHGIGYFIEIYHVVIHGKGLLQPDDSPPPLESYPPLAIIVSSFNEPLEVVEDTLITFYNLTYPNKYIYFLDDTRYDMPGQDLEERKRYRQSIDEMCQRIGVRLFRRQWRGAKAGMINDFLDYIEGKEKQGFEYHDYSGTEKRKKEKYIVVFDADQNPFPEFIEPLIARMEADPKLAFIQTPQYYTNFDSNRIARASGLQQAIFYEYICEGKSQSDAMFCCGTNVIFRREALMDVGGFDETSVTEDFATSLKFHLKGWRSAYFSKVQAFGMGPEDLGGYFKQQFRWALGTVGLFRNVLGFFLHHPKQLVFVKWWEYFLSSTHYFIGLVFLILVLCPLLYMFLNVPSYFARPEIYALFFVPYFTLTITTFFWTLRQRKYAFKDLVRGQLLMAITFPVYIKASILGLMGVKGTFEITPKGGAMQLALKSLWPQLSLAILNFSAVIWGINRLIYEREPMIALMVNMCWCFYHFLILSSVLYFNNTEQGRYDDI